MSMLKARTRLINFRVTDEEFERLKSASGRQGARCMSDFARTLMLAQSGDLYHGSFDDKLLSLDRRLTNLERSMARLVTALSGTQLQA